MPGNRMITQTAGVNGNGARLSEQSTQRSAEDAEARKMLVLCGSALLRGPCVERVGGL
jgi:hypothetical protein